MMAFILALSISCFVSSVAAETGCYKVSQTMEQWKEEYPTGIPNDIHYSGMAIITHTAAYSLSEVGNAASAGLKLLAETGNSNSGAGTLQTEVTASAAASTLTRLAPIIAPGSDQTASPNTKRGFADAHIEVDSNFPMVSLATMIAPSPDWYAFGKATLFENGEFQTKTINLYAYDAGTDSGANYNASDNATNPVGQISYLDHGVEGPSTNSSTNRLMMTMMFEPMCCYTAVQSDMDRWVTVYNDSLPTNPHYSSMVAWTWSDGSLLNNSVSSTGAQALAETGATDTFISELNSYSFTPSSTSLMAAQKLTVMAGTGQSAANPNTKRMFQNFRMMVSTTFPKVGMMTMIAPSPDWYAYGEANLVENGSWQDKTITLIAYDAGTEDGTGYSTTNNATSPQGVISKLTYGVTGPSVTGDRTMFSMAFTADATCNIGTTTPGPSRRMTSTEIGSFSVSVDATAVEVKSSTELAMGKFLFDGGVQNSGSNTCAAVGLVTAVVTTSRRLTEQRGLAVTNYNVAWTIAVPDADATNAQTVVEGMTSASLQAEMLAQFASAGVTTATQATLSSFIVTTRFQGGSQLESSLAVRTTKELSAMLMILMSCLALLSVIS